MSDISAAMQFIGEIDGRKFYFADKSFAEPGIYYWNGSSNVSVFPINAESTYADDVGIAARHGLFVYEVDFGDEGKGRYIRLNDFNQIIAKYDAASEPFARHNSSDQFIDIRVPTSAVTRLRALLTTTPSPQGEAAGRVTDAMVDAYLAAQAKAVQAVDDKWGNGGRAASYLHPVREACRAGIAAALATAQQPDPPPSDVGLR